MDVIHQDLQDIEKLFHASKDVLLTTRMNPRIDGICSILAFARAFELMPLTSLTGPGQSRKVIKSISGRQGSQMALLPGASTIVSELGLRDFVIAMPGYVDESVDSVSWYVDQGRLNVVVKSNPAVPMQLDPKLFDPFYAGANFDVVCVIDADSPVDMGNLYRQDPGMFSELPVVNISNSAANSKFGRVNVVDQQVSSVSELIYELLSALHVHIDADIAGLLLCGILDATENLTQRLTPRTQEIVQELQNVGPVNIDLYGVRAQLNLPPLAIHPNGQVANIPQSSQMPYQQQMPPMPNAYPGAYSQSMPQAVPPTGYYPQAGTPYGPQNYPPNPYMAPPQGYTMPQAPQQMNNFTQYHAPTNQSVPGYNPPPAYDPNRPWPQGGQSGSGENGSRG